MNIIFAVDVFYKEWYILFVENQNQNGRLDMDFLSEEHFQRLKDLNAFGRCKKINKDLELIEAGYIRTIDYRWGNTTFTDVVLTREGREKYVEMARVVGETLTV